jgi:hypothetical protein
VARKEADATDAADAVDEAGARYAREEENLDEHGCRYKLYGFTEYSPQILAAQCQVCL